MQPSAPPAGPAAAVGSQFNVSKPSMDVTLRLRSVPVQVIFLPFKMLSISQSRLSFQLYIISLIQEIMCGRFNEKKTFQLMIILLSFRQ